MNGSVTVVYSLIYGLLWQAGVTHCADNNSLMKYDDDSESELLGPVQESHQSLIEGANSESNDPVDFQTLQECNE